MAPFKTSRAFTLVIAFAVSDDRSSDCPSFTYGSAGRVFTIAFTASFRVVSRPTRSGRQSPELALSLPAGTSAGNTDERDTGQRAMLLQVRLDDRALAVQMFVRHDAKPRGDTAPGERSLRPV